MNQNDKQVSGTLFIVNKIQFGWYIPCYQRAFSAIYQNYFWKLTLQISSPSRENCQTQFLRENRF